MFDTPVYDKEWWEKFRHEEVQYILELTGRKNSDYTGGDGCNNPFANFDASVVFNVDPLTGVCVRMQDKFQRAKAFCSGEGHLQRPNRLLTDRNRYAGASKIKTSSFILI